MSASHAPRVSLFGAVAACPPRYNLNVLSELDDRHHRIYIYPNNTQALAMGDHDDKAPAASRGSQNTAAKSTDVRRTEDDLASFKSTKKSKASDQAAGNSVQEEDLSRRHRLDRFTLARLTPSKAF